MPTKTKAPAKSPIIRHVEFIVGGIHYFEMGSHSRPDVKHVQEICVESGLVRCSCEHFTYKLAPKEPTLATPDLHCSHISAGKEWLLNEGYLDSRDLQAMEILGALQPCIRCSMSDAEYPIIDEQGRLTHDFMCRECLAQLRAEHEQWSPHAQELRGQIAELETRRDELKTELKAMPDLKSLAHELTELEARLMDMWRSYNACEVLH